MAVIRNAGDAALLVEFGDTLDLAVNRAAMAFDRKLRRVKLTGVSDTVPTLRSVLVRFDPLQVHPDELQTTIEQLLQDNSRPADPDSHSRRWQIPLYYGGEFEHELLQVADHLQLDREAVIAQHAAAQLRVLALGFAPGFTYLGLLPENWNIPRLNDVKPQVPAGAVSVAVRQSVMTSTPIPTGWLTIGITPFSNFNLQQDPPFTIGPGDVINFCRIDQQQYEQAIDDQRRGRFTLQADRLE